METLFAETHRTLEEVGGYFIQLEKSLGHPDGVQIENTIGRKLDGLNGNFDRLEIYIMKEHPSKRQAPRLRLNQMKYDAQHLMASLRSFKQKRAARERENTEREDLLNRRFTTNSATSINIDYSIQHNSSLHNANRGVDDILNQGYSMLGNLQDQRNMLKRTRKRMLDFLNTLGLSNTVMQLIEKRAYQDKFVLMGGMMVTLTIMFFIYMYFV
jgi:Golgi SNAP receptor complex protein 2